MRGEVSRLGSKNSGIQSVLNTWEGKITTGLEADGKFTITIDSFNGNLPVKLSGNVNDSSLDI